jgi:hypothetical protein
MWRPSGEQTGREQPAGQGEGGQGHLAVGGVADDARGALAAALAPRPLLGRELLPAAAQQRDRVRGHALGRPIGRQDHCSPGWSTGLRKIQYLEQVRPFGPAAGAEEHHAATVRGDGEGTGRTEREALRPGVLPGEGDLRGHPPTLVRGSGAPATDSKRTGGFARPFGCSRPPRPRAVDAVPVRQRSGICMMTVSDSQVTRWVSGPGSENRRPMPAPARRSAVPAAPLLRGESR